MSPRPDVSEERRLQILEAATTVFSRLGFHKARMDDIVKESGLSKGALYWYFKSKDEIIIAILDRIFEREFAHLRQLPSHKGSATDRLLKFSEIVIEDMQRMLRLLPLTYEFFALAFRQKIVRQGLQRYFRAYLEIIEPIIQQGIDNGEFRPVNATDVALAVGAIIEGTGLLWVYDSEHVQIDKHIRSGFEIILAGIRA